MHFGMGLHGIKLRLILRQVASTTYFPNGHDDCTFMTFYIIAHLRVIDDFQTLCIATGRYYFGFVLKFASLIFVNAYQFGNTQPHVI